MRTRPLLGLLLLGGSSIAVAQPYDYGDRYRGDDDRYTDEDRHVDEDPRFDEDTSHPRYNPYRQGDRFGGAVQLVPGWRLNPGRNGYASARIDARAGRFRAIRIDGHGRPTFVDTVVVHFANGRTRRIQLRRWLSERDPSVVVDLPGNAHRLSGIEIYGQSRGEAGLEIVGLR